MGTLEIMRALLFHIQGESDPIYRVERHTALPWRSPDLSRWGGCLFLLLLLGVPTLTFLERYLGIQMAGYRTLVLQILLTVGGSLVSIGWTTPIAMLAGQGISRERTAQTWDMLLVLPQTTETVLLAKAAARIQPVWRMAISLSLIVSIIGVFAIGPTTIFRTLATGESLLWGILAMLVGMVAVIVEREQEIALAVVLGITAAFVSDSRRMSLFFGLIGGLLIRLIQILLTVMLTLMLVPQLPENFALLNIIGGTAAVIIAAPGLMALIGLGVVLVVREALIRVLFTWLTRRAREE